MKTTATILLGAILLSGCATSYQVDGFTGGQAPKWRATDVLEIESKGNGYTSSSKLKRMTLLRAAETAIAADYRYFIEVGSENTSKNTTAYMPTTTTTSVTGTNSPTGFSGTATTYNYGGAYNISKPGVNAVYKMFVELPSDARPGQFHDAYEVYNRLGKKYAKKFKPKYPKG